MKVRALAAERGVDPLEVMFETMVDLKCCASRKGVPEERRLELEERAAQIARMAAPYMYPRLRHIEVEDASMADAADAILARMTEDEIFEQLRRRREERAATVVDAERDASGDVKARPRNWRIVTPARGGVMPPPSVSTSSPS